MTTYNVTAKRWAHGWELHIADVGVSQSTTLASAEKMAREYISLALDIEDQDSFDVTITPELDDDTRRELDHARRCTEAAESAQREAAATWRRAVHSLKDKGLVSADIARLLHLSKQRVSQLVASR